MKAFKLEVPSELLHIPLVGNYFRAPASQKLLAAAKQFDLVFMRRDPMNPKDANAVKMLIPDGPQMTLVGFAQRHSALRLTNFLKAVPNCLPEDYVVGGLGILGKEHEVIPFGVTGKNDVAEMIRRYAESRGRYETLIKSLLEK